MTTSARSAIRSVTLPLPSSPHWAPTTTSPGMSETLFRVVRRDVGIAVHWTWAERAAGGASSDRATSHGRARTTSGGARAGELSLAIHVGELRVARQEREDHLAHGPVAVLGDDDVGLAGTLRVAVVVLVAVDEHDEVRILLDLARLAQVREQWLLVRPRL